MARTRRTGSFNHRRQVVLFLAAIVLPSLVLIALTLRAIGQEHELAEQRAVDHRRSIARQFGQELLRGPGDTCIGSYHVWTAVLGPPCRRARPPTALRSIAGLPRHARP